MQASSLLSIFFVSFVCNSCILEKSQKINAEKVWGVEKVTVAVEAVCFVSKQVFFLYVGVIAWMK